MYQVWSIKVDNQRNQVIEDEIEEYDDAIVFAEDHANELNSRVLVTRDGWAMETVLPDSEKFPEN